MRMDSAVESRLAWWPEWLAMQAIATVGHGRRVISSV